MKFHFFDSIQKALSRSCRESGHSIAHFLPAYQNVGLLACIEVVSSATRNNKMDDNEKLLLTLSIVIFCFFLRDTDTGQILKKIVSLIDSLLNINMSSFESLR